MVPTNFITNPPVIGLVLWANKKYRKPWFFLPIGSMYAIYGNMYHQYTPFMLAYIYIYHTWSIWIMTCGAFRFQFSLPIQSTRRFSSHPPASPKQLPLEQRALHRWPKLGASMAKHGALTIEPKELPEKKLVFSMWIERAGWTTVY